MAFTSVLLLSLTLSRISAQKAYYQSGTTTASPAHGGDASTTTPAGHSTATCPPPPGTVDIPQSIPRTTPAAGVKGPKDFVPVWSDVGGVPWDYLSGMSKRGWQLALDTHNKILQAAGRNVNTSFPGGATVALFAARVYAETLWFTNLKDYFPLNGDPENLWTFSTIRPRNAFNVASNFGAQIAAMANAEDGDYSAFLKIVDDLAYQVHYQIELGRFGPLPITKIGLFTFMQEARAHIYMCKYFLGDECTEDRLESYTWAIYFIDFINWHFLNLYEIGCKDRNKIDDFTILDPTIKVVNAKKK